MTRLPDDLKRFLFLVPYVAQEPDGVPLAELCEKLSATPAELRRLIDRVIAVGTPDGSPDEMVEIHLEAGRVHVELPQRFTSPPRFSPEEVVALLVVLSPLRGAALPELAERARRLSEALVGLASRRGAELAPRIQDRMVVEGERTETPEHLERLERAIAEHRVVDMEYYTRSRDALSRRRMEPCGLVWHRGAWYAVGSDRRLFKVERVRSLELTDDRFEPPADLDLSVYEKGLFGDRDEAAAREQVTIRFGERTRTFPAWSATHTRAWVRSMRGRGELVAPEALRRELVEETRALLDRYG